VTKGCNKVVDLLWAGILVDVPRTIWKGALSFGLVNIPVGLYPATSDKSIHFNQFEEGTSDRIRYKKINERTGDEVPQDKIVRGFDLGGGEYVILTEEELESAEPKKSRQIEISDFVGLVDIDPVFFRSSYYLAPEGAGADKAYALLRRAMAEAGRVAIATLVMRNKEYLVAIRPEDDALALHTMYFSDEVRAPGRDLELPETGDVTDRELSMAQLLIESMESEWDPDRFHDTHREKVEALIEEKRNGHEIVLQEGPEPAAKVVDLMEALNASIAAAARPDAESKSTKSPKRASSSKRTTAKRATPAKKASKATKTAARPKTVARRKAS
jgi:DNA end-binding protein Ku